jgi:mannose-6-phosphate isomerase-like protein (cupin superfamily)
MDYKNLFEKFNEEGKLLLPEATITFDVIPWSKHPTFEGVELKHIITSERTDGQFSYHLVRIAPNKKIGNHIHERQLETHEVIFGTGVCVNDGVELPYEAGVISIFPIGVPHEVIAGDDGLYLFAKFMPALC